MSSTTDKNKHKLFKELRNKEYRDAFVSEHIDTGIPFQIRSLREQREWTQEKLAKKSGMKQESISRNENPNYGKLSLSTLKKIASAFDVGLIVRFVPLGDIADWDLHLSPESLRVPSFKDDPYFKETKIDTKSELPPAPQQQQLFSNVIYLALRKKGEEAISHNTLRGSQQIDQAPGPEDNQSIREAWK